MNSVVYKRDRRSVSAIRMGLKARTSREICFLLGKGDLTHLLTDEEFKRFLKALGIRIKTLRKDKNFNMRDIMIATGYYDTQWRKYEAGGSMNLQSLMKVALALDVSLAELFDGLAEWPKLSVSEIEGQAAFKAGKSHHRANAGLPEPSDHTRTSDSKAAKKSSAAKRSDSSPSRASPTSAKTPPMLKAK